MRKTLTFALLWLAAATTAIAGNLKEIEGILTQPTPPFGVVFEIVEGRGDALQWAIPTVNDYVKQLRQRFPTISLAVVSHGNEQFGLMTSQQGKNAEVHDIVQSLANSDVPVHVCGTHAAWKGKTEEDFPDYVDVAPSGPTQINNYEAMGYQVVKVSR